MYHFSPKHMKKPFPIFNAKEQCKAFYFYDVLKRKVFNKRMIIIDMKKPFFSSTQQAYKSKKGARHFIQGGRVYTFFFRPTIATAVALSRLSVCRVHTHVPTTYMYNVHVRTLFRSQTSKNQLGRKKFLGRKTATKKFNLGSLSP